MSAYFTKLYSGIIHSRHSTAVLKREALTHG